MLNKTKIELHQLVYRFFYATESLEHSKFMFYVLNVQGLILRGKQPRLLTLKISLVVIKLARNNIGLLLSIIFLIIIPNRVSRTRKRSEVCRIFKVC